MPADVPETIARVIGCSPADAVASAVLSDLGVDSLALVEIADELGRRTGGYLPDRALAGVRTVADLHAVVEANHDTPAPAWVGQAAWVHTSWDPDGRHAVVGRDDNAPRVPTSRVRARRLAIATGMIGALIGAGAGLTGLAGALAIGLPELHLPPLAAPSPTASASPEPSAEPSATPTAAPTIQTDRSAVLPGQQFTLRGAIPALGAGEVLQVQRRDANSDWTDFPLTSTTREGGTFVVDIFQERTGTFAFRLRHAATDSSTPEATVEIGSAARD